MQAKDMNTDEVQQMQGQGKGIDLKRAYRALIKGYLEAAMQGRIPINGEYLHADGDRESNETKGDDEQREANDIG